MLWLRFASQIWNDGVAEIFSTAAKGQEWWCRHKWKVLRQDKGYEVSNEIRWLQDSSIVTGVTQPQAVVSRRNQSGICAIGVWSHQAELCWVTDAMSLGLTGSLPNYCMCGCRAPVVPFLPTSKTTFPLKTIPDSGQRGLQTTLSNLSCSKQGQRSGQLTASERVGEMNSYLKLGA